MHTYVGAFAFDYHLPYSQSGNIYGSTVPGGVFGGEQGSQIDFPHSGTNDSFLQPPYSLSFFPSGKGEKIPYLYTISDPKVQVSAFFLREDGKAVMRLFETTGYPRQVQVEIPVLQYKQTVSLSPWEFYTLEIDLHK